MNIKTNTTLESLQKSHIWEENSGKLRQNITIYDIVAIAKYKKIKQASEDKLRELIELANNTLLYSDIYSFRDLAKEELRKMLGGVESFKQMFFEQFTNLDKLTYSIENREGPFWSDQFVISKETGNVFNLALI